MNRNVFSGLTATFLILFFLGSVPVYAGDGGDEADGVKAPENATIEDQVRHREENDRGDDRRDQDRPQGGEYDPARPISVGIVYLPNNGNDVNGIGLEFFNMDNEMPQCWSIWFAGDPGFFAPDGYVGDYIPHDDFIRYEDTGEVGFVYCFGSGGPDAYVFLGGGLTIVATQYTDISNVTGWSWDGGTGDHEFIPHGQISVVVMLGDSVGLQVGYDTHYELFFGLTF